MPRTIRALSRVLGISITMASLATSAVAAEQRVLEKGDRLPELTFTDILGTKAGAVDYPEHIQIVSFATQESSEELMGWMSGLTKQVSSAYPNASLVYFSFANLTEVPAFLRPIARPILENMIGSEIEPLRKRFVAKPTTDGLPAPKPPEFHLVPDWDGSFLEKFGYEELEGYHCYVAYKGKILGHFTADTANKDEAFLGVFTKLHKDIESAKAVASPLPSKAPTDS